MNAFRIKPNQLLLSTQIFNDFIRYKTTSTAEYCLESVKRYDYENFMCTLLLKNSARACAFAIRGFNVELARVGEQVSDPNIGLMRLQFWEDAVNNCFSNNVAKIPQHPVATELYKAITKSKLTKRYFTTLIASRRMRLKTNGFANLEDIETYSEKSVSNVYYLILEGNNCRNVNADHAASHLGKAQGIVQQLRSTSLSKRLNIIPIPQDILIKHKVSQEELLRGMQSERLNDCAFEVASRAYQHLQKARNLLREVPIEARGVLLPAIAVGNYLERLQKVNYDLLHPRLQQRSWTWLVKLWLTNFQNKY